MGRRKNGIKTVRIFQEESEGLFSKGKAERKAMSQIVKKIEEYVPDIIHAHNLETLEAATEAAKFNNAKLIFDIHEDIPAVKGKNRWFLARTTQNAKFFTEESRCCYYSI